MKSEHFMPIFYLVYVLYTIQLVQSSSDSTKALVGCGACQGVQAKDFMCDVSCEVLGQKGE